MQLDVFNGCLSHMFIVYVISSLRKASRIVSVCIYIVFYLYYLFYLFYLACLFFVFVVFYLY